uniref:SIN3-HDAC complex associated factor n=1 Tax=Sus scrofa TaxID=9823 RepID=A0A8D0X3L8_PIG
MWGEAQPGAAAEHRSGNREAFDCFRGNPRARRGPPHPSRAVRSPHDQGTQPRRHPKTTAGKFGDCRYPTKGSEDCERITCPEEKMFGFHKPKMYRSIEGCCICRAKSSSSRFTDSKRYEKDFQSCFGLHETRSGDICNACVLLVKRWKKLPAGSKKNWNHVVDARAGPSLKTTLKPKKVKTLSGNRIKSNQISKLQKEFKRHNSDAHSTTSSASPAQSPCYSNQSDDGSDTEMASGSNRTPVFSFLDLTYWKRQKICCGIIYKGRFGEVLIDTHLFKPCCSNKKAAAEKPEEQGPEPLPISTQEW